MSSPNSILCAATLHVTKHLDSHLTPVLGIDFSSDGSISLLELFRLYDDFEGNKISFAEFKVALLGTS